MTMPPGQSHPILSIFLRMPDPNIGTSQEKFPYDMLSYGEIVHVHQGMT